MTEFRNQFYVKVTRYTKTENGERVEDGTFTSRVFGISNGGMQFLVYDLGDKTHLPQFRWVNFYKERVELIDLAVDN